MSSLLDLGTTTTNFMKFAPMFTAALGLLDVTVLSAWMMGMFEPIFLIYAGDFIALITSLCTAAYVAVKTVDAAVSFNDGFAFTYRVSTWIGNMLGLWEIIAFFMFMGWGLFVIFGAYYHASYIMDMGQARETAAYEDGKFGSAATFTDAIKFFVLLMIQAFAVWIAGYSLGNNVDELVDYMNHYSDKTKDDGTDKDGNGNATEYAPEGTAALADLGYHAVTLLYAWTLYTAIMVMGYFFSWYFAAFHPVYESCDIDEYDSSKYSGLEKSIMDIPKGTYDECKATIEKVFKTLDLNNDGYLDRCEDAKFLMAVNNNKEYAQKYSGDASLQGLYKYCDYAVLDAFDRPNETDYFWLENLVSRLAGVFPFNYLFFTDDRLVYWIRNKDDTHDIDTDAVV